MHAETGNKKKKKKETTNYFTILKDFIIIQSEKKSGPDFFTLNDEELYTLYFEKDLGASYVNELHLVRQNFVKNMGDYELGGVFVSIFDDIWIVKEMSYLKMIILKMKFI